MKHGAVAILIAALLASTAYAQSPNDTSKKAASTPPKSRSFIDRVLDFLAISYTPGAQKGPAPSVSDGQIWIAEVKTGSTRALTTDANYRSPVLLAGGTDVLALRGSDIVRIPSSGGEGIKVHSAGGIVKLVGAGSRDPRRILVLLRNESSSHPHVGLLEVDTGTVTDLPYDPQSSEDLQMVEDLEGWSRSCADSRVFVKRQTKELLAGTMEWSDVFLVAHGQPPVDVSRCDGVNCGQPSLSQDGSRVVYVRQKSD